MALDPNIWGPHYWFVLHTIALSYPHTPNEVMRKKYYDFVQNIPLFFKTVYIFFRLTDFCNPNYSIWQYLLK